MRILPLLLPSASRGPTLPRHEELMQEDTMRRTLKLALCAAASVLALPAGGMAATSGLMAGAARIDITPDPADLPAPLTSVHDPLYIRTLVVDSDGRRAVVVVVDTPAIEASIYYDLVGRISAEFDVPEGQILLSTTHTHNSLRVAPPGESPIPVSDKFTAAVIDGTLRSVRDAVAQMVPARAAMPPGSPR